MYKEKHFHNGHKQELQFSYLSLIWHTFFILWSHKSPLFLVKPSHFWWNSPLMWSSLLFPTANLHKNLNPIHTPPILSPYIYLTALCAPSRTFLTVWFNQQRQIITFLFVSLMSVKGSGATDWTDVGVFGSVVSWLDEQMQTWLPLCESSLLTTVTKNQSEAFLPVYILYKAACWQQELGIGPANQQFVLLNILPLRYFGYLPFLFLSIVWQIKKRKNTLVCVLGCKWQT